MFFNNSQRYVSIAKQIINEINHGGDNPEELLNKYAKEYNLNNNMKQRVVEEYNVNMFLSKLKDGNHQEHYVLLNPVINETQKWNSIIEKNNKENEHKKNMTKTAFYNEEANIVFKNNSMEYEHDPLLNGSFSNKTLVSSFEYGDTSDLLKNASYKEKLREEEGFKELVKTAHYKGHEVINQLANDLTKVANISTGATKTIIYDLIKEGHEDIANTVMENCKYKPNEILGAKMTDGIFEQDLPLLKTSQELIKEATISKLIMRVISEKGMNHIGSALNKIKTMAGPKNRAKIYMAYVMNKFFTEKKPGALHNDFIQNA